ncbi:MAG: hypothetical protein ACK413_02220 [Patescibacteria group bacterium]
MPEEIKTEEKEEPIKIALPKEFIRKRKKSRFLISLIILLIVLVGGSFLLAAFGFWKLKKIEKPLPSPSVLSPTRPTTPFLISISDSDGDGLTDEEEKKLGTNPYSVDSDQDGLFDREEVKVYQTDPLNPDTDNDGYSDGQEVKSGYDPKNPDPNAKILDLKKEIEKMK